ncbi:hypothetical protein BSLG_004817 [Batrachochytrium salamandrivorans]|nr:hypothetical protein BSLG_004817 [Batrachochytrium salamandrivorans]
MANRGPVGKEVNNSSHGMEGSGYADSHAKLGMSESMITTRDYGHPARASDWPERRDTMMAGSDISPGYSHGHTRYYDGRASSNNSDIGYRSPGIQCSRGAETVRLPIPHAYASSQYMHDGPPPSLTQATQRLPVHLSDVRQPEERHRISAEMVYQGSSGHHDRQSPVKAIPSSTYKSSSSSSIAPSLLRPSNYMQPTHEYPIPAVTGTRGMMAQSSAESAASQTGSLTSNGQAVINPLTSSQAVGGDASGGVWVGTTARIEPGVDTWMSDSVSADARSSTTTTTAGAAHHHRVGSSAAQPSINPKVAAMSNNIPASHNNTNASNSSSSIRHYHKGGHIYSSNDAGSTHVSVSDPTLSSSSSSHGRTMTAAAIPFAPPDPIHSETHIPSSGSSHDMNSSQFRHPRQTTHRRHLYRRNNYHDSNPHRSGHDGRVQSVTVADPKVMLSDVSDNQEAAAVVAAHGGRQPRWSRQSNACDYCHSKKIRCHGPIGSCPNCVKRGLVCAFNRKTKPKRPTEYIAQLQNRIESLENVVVVRDNRQGIQPALSPSTDTSKSPSSFVQRVAAGSQSSRLSAHNIDLSVGINNEAHMADVRAAFISPQNASNRHASYSDLYPLQSPALIRTDLIERWFKYCSLRQNALIIPSWFFSDLQSHSPLLLHSIYAQAASLSSDSGKICASPDHRSTISSPEGDAFYETAKSFVSEALSCASYRNVLALQLLANLAMIRGKPEGPFYMASAIRLMQLCMRDYEPDDGQRYPQNCNQELVRRLWWSLYESDRRISFINDLPLQPIDLSNGGAPGLPQDLLVDFHIGERRGDSQAKDWQAPPTLEKARPSPFLPPPPNMAPYTYPYSPPQASSSIRDEKGRLLQAHFVKDPYPPSASDSEQRYPFKRPSFTSAVPLWRSNDSASYGQDALPRTQPSSLSGSGSSRSNSESPNRPLSASGELSASPNTPSGSPHMMRDVHSYEVSAMDDSHHQPHPSHKEPLHESTLSVTGQRLLLLLLYDRIAYFTQTVESRCDVATTEKCRWDLDHELLTWFGRLPVAWRMIPPTYGFQSTNATLDAYFKASGSLRNTPRDAFSDPSSVVDTDGDPSSDPLRSVALEPSSMALSDGGIQTFDNSGRLTWGVAFLIISFNFCRLLLHRGPLQLVNRTALLTHHGDSSLSSTNGRSSSDPGPTFVSDKESLSRPICLDSAFSLLDITKRFMHSNPFFYEVPPIIFRLISDAAIVIVIGMEAGLVGLDRGVREVRMALDALDNLTPQVAGADHQMATLGSMLNDVIKRRGGESV